MKDLIILGNGMAGMTAALYAKRANLDFKIVGRDEYDFGQIGNAILVENYPCAAPLSGMDLAMKLHEQLIGNDIQIEEHTVRQVRKTEDMFVIDYEDNSADVAKAVIYALGARHKKLNCKTQGDVNFHYCALCDGALYKDKSVAIIGGGDVAFTQAEYLSKICKDVGIIMCDENVTANSQIFKRVNQINNIEIVYNFPITAIGRNSDCTYLLSSKNIAKYFIVDGIFIAIGMIPNTQEIISSSLSLITDTFGYIQTDENCKTAIGGFFAVGDVRAKSTRQALTAAADGANAVTSVINYLKS